MFLGIDVGSISMKFVLFIEAGGAVPPPEVLKTFLSPEPVPLGASGTGYLLSYDRLLGDPMRRVPERFRSWIAALGEERVSGVAVTGKSGRQLAPLVGGAYENDFRCLVKAVAASHPEVRTIFEMGGENAKVVRLRAAGADGGLTIRDYDTNGDCAAGTGSFIDQQAHRMKIEVEAIGDMVGQAASAARIAGRCSVFAKTDMIHAQQKGYSPEEILKGLCEAVARNFKSNINKGKDPVPVVALVGGLFANAGVVRAVRDVFGFEAGESVCPRGFAHMAAFGAAMAAAEAGRGREIRRAVPEPASVEDAGERGFPAWPRLSTGNVVFLRDREQPLPEVPRGTEVFLGIDIGSVSTNFVLLDREGRLLKEIYVRTQGRPVQVVTEGLRDLRDEFGDSVRVRGVGTTGSGRELIGELVGADTVQDEITAHKTGSAFISDRFFGVPVDTIFEIGGQDSKYIALENGVVTDFAMNDACAAGTGSFLEEQAERLGISIQGEFAELALSSGAPVRMGERCTVFMEQDLNNYLYRGARKEDLVAGLAYSVVMNYLNRVVRGRKIGETIYFQGGTAYNDAVAAAFSQVLGRKIIVPPHNGVIGAIGMALLARDKIRATGRPRPSADSTCPRSTTSGGSSSARGAATTATCRRSGSGTAAPTGATNAPRGSASPHGPTRSPSSRTSWRGGESGSTHWSRRPPKRGPEAPSASRGRCTSSSGFRSGGRCFPAWGSASRYPPGPTRRSRGKGSSAPSPNRAIPSRWPMGTWRRSSRGGSTSSSCRT
jgi:predicted CoA-substrate-specific enzyme activase